MMRDQESGPHSHYLDLDEVNTATPEQEETTAASEERTFDETGMPELLFQTQRRVNQIEQQLFATAPTAKVPLRVGGRTLRGRWAPLDLVGAPTGSLLIGVLESPLSRQASWEATEGLRRLIRQRTESHETNARTGHISSDLPVTVSVRGGLLVAVASAQFAEPWDLLVN